MANGNQQNVSPANLFVGGTASTDGAYQLRTGSPTIGMGENVTINTRRAPTTN